MRNDNWYDSYTLNIYKDGRVELVNGIGDVILSKPSFTECGEESMSWGRITSLGDFLSEFGILIERDLYHIKEVA